MKIIDLCFECGDIVPLRGVAAVNEKGCAGNMHPSAIRMDLASVKSVSK